MRLLLAAGALAMLAATASADQDTYVSVERGRDLATAGDCIACHTRAGSPPFSGGRSLETPFGVINTANLTPDPETGIGAWTEDDFYRAMHEGTRPGGGHLYPAFPYPYYTKVTRPDVDAIFAFLRTLPPARNAVDRDALPFPFDIRASVVAWNALNFVPGEYQPDPKRSEQFNRGGYLVEGLGHCGACHTPMNSLGGSKDGQFLQGNQIQSWVAPNLTNDLRTGLGSWSADEIVAYLRTGRTAKSAASGPMAEVVMYSTSQMPENDLRAMATYLKERGAEGPAAIAPQAANSPQMVAGLAVYSDTCKACHVQSGAGIPLLFPALAGSQIVQQTDPTTLIRVVLTGTRAAATAAAPTAPAMPSLGWRLSDEQVASVLTYVRNAWGNSAPPVTPSEVAGLRGKLSARAN